MKAIFIACSQSMYDEIVSDMGKMGVRGYTSWEELTGCGSDTGEPHLGNHAWPTMNSAILTMVDDGKVPEIMKHLKAMDTANEKQGIRAFVWDIADMI